MDRQRQVRWRLRLSLEKLETRNLLAAELEPAWAIYDDQPVDRDSERMIVQLTEDATRELRTSSAIADFFDKTPGVDVLYGLGTPGQFAVSFDHDSTTACFLGESSVEWVQQETLVDGFAIPDDPSFDSQHGLRNTAQNGGIVGADIDAAQAWDITTGSLANVAAVIDSGIDYTHPDLFGNVWINQGEIPSAIRSSLTDTDNDGLITFRDLNQGVNASLVSDLNGNSFIDAGDLLADARWENGIDDDANSFVDDLVGWDFRNNDNDPFDDHRHGTHVSGILGARGDNGIGIAGVNWDVQLMPLKFLDQTNNGSTIDAIRAIRYATMMREDFGVNIRASNNSWGSLGTPDLALQDAISDHGDADILFVAGAGNGEVFLRGIDLDADSRGFFPASFDLGNVISVAASDTDDELAFFSNFGGSSVDVSAPGVGILSTQPSGLYGSRNGTSMATPHVTGAAMLVWANLPDATVAEVRDAILGSTDSVASSNGNLSTGGQLNARGALEIDTFAPRATMTQPDVITSDGGTEQQLTVAIRDNAVVDVSSIDAADIRVIRRDGAGEPLSVALLFQSSNVNLPSLTAVYSVAAPGGTWDRDDNGIYDVVLVPGEISDDKGITNFEIPLGSFTVDIDFAGDIPITTFADGADDDPTDGVSADRFGNSTLRSAIQTANAEPGENTLILEPGTYTLSVGGTGEDAAATGDLDVTDTLTILGNGSVIDAASLDRVFDVTATGTLHLQDLTITGGNVIGDGAGINSLGNVTLTNVTLHGNEASGAGGGIAASGAATTLINTTISTNQASNGAGIRLASSGSADLRSVTVTNNTASSSSGGILSEGTLGIRNTIVSGNTASDNPDVQGSFSTGGHNLVGIVGSASGFTNSLFGDQIGTLENPIDALLGPLQDNTGGLLTHVPQSQSPAVDAGDNVDTPPTDARGIERILDANRDREAVIDIGAVEKFFGSIEGVAFIDRDGDGERHIAVDVPFTGIEEMTAVGDTLYFTFDDGEHGRELWKINDFGARLVADISVGLSGSTPSSLVDVNGLLYFAADNGVLGRELWKSDGTRNGTVLVRDINSTEGSSNPTGLTSVGGTVYFAADDGDNGSELWKSDGTENGTVLVRSIMDGPSGSFPEELTNIDGTLFFTAIDAVSGRELWASQGTSSNTNQVVDINSNVSSDPKEITLVGETVFFTAESGFGRDLYRTETPFDTATMITGPALASPSNARELINANGTLVFAADGPNGNEIFKSSSPFNIVTEVADIFPGTRSSSPANLTVVDGGVFFTATDGNLGRELWISSGTLETANMVSDINPGPSDASPSSLFELNGQLIFTANDGVSGTELWQSDPTASAVLQISDIRPGASSSFVQNAVNVSGQAYFLASPIDESNSVLWQSDGTVAGTQQSIDFDEKALSGQAIFLDLDGNGLHDATEPIAISDASGTYQFDDVVPGTYQIEFVQNDRLNNTFPNNAEGAIVALSDFASINGSPYRMSQIQFPATSSFFAPVSIGDLNGDGFADLLTQSTSSYFAVLGSQDGLPNHLDVNSALADGGNVLEIERSDQNIQYDGISFVGDLNGDGFGDFSYFDDATVTVVYGRATFPSGKTTFSELSSLPDGVPGGFQFSSPGRSSRVGDLNGDGLDDLAVGVREGASLDSEFAAFIVYGSTVVPDIDFETLANGDGLTGFVIHGETLPATNGTAVGYAGDLNDDGIDDLYVESTGNRRSRYLVFGRRSGFNSRLSVDELESQNGGDGTLGFSIKIIESDTGTNSSFVDSNDINGDGIDDLFFQMNGPRVLLGSAEGFPAEVFPTAFFDANAPFVFAADLTSIPAASAGDFDGDGFGDIALLSQFTESGFVRVLRGMPRAGFEELFVSPTTARIRSEDLFRSNRGAKGEFGFELQGGAEELRIGNFGAAGANNAWFSAGDINGDGLSDLAIGSRQGGRVFLVYGQSQNVADGSFGSWEVRIQPGNLASGIDFGFEPNRSQITGRVFRDLNNNNAEDAGEVGVSGAKLFVDENDNRSLDEGESFAVTDSDGRYSFTDLEAFDTYVVRQVLKADVEQTFPTLANDGAYEITLGAGEVFENADFGNRDLIAGVGVAVVKGRLFDDANGNGVQDSGDAGIAGQTVYVDLDNDQVRDLNEPVATTDATGQYELSGLAGNQAYNVRLDSDSVLSLPRGNAFSQVTLQSGEVPQAIASTDLDGDGDVDLVVANSETNSVSLLFNQGGVFSKLRDGNGNELPDLSVGFAPTDIVVADIDGKNGVDLIVGHQNSEFIGILLNNGDGTFAENFELPTRSGPAKLDVADLDLDGKLDIVVANQFADSISIFYNNTDIANQGALQFDSGMHLPIGDPAMSSPSSVSIGSLDTNFGPDIVVTNSSESTVTIVLQSGPRTFSVQTPVSLGERRAPVDSVVDDLDGDGVQDLAIANFLRGTVSVMYGVGFAGIGNGAFEPPIELDAGKGASSITVADLEGDGRLDLLVTNATPQNLAVFRNLGNRVFQSPESFGVSEIPETLAREVAIGLFNEDDVLDVAVANGNADSVSLLSSSLVEGSYRIPIQGDETITEVNFGIVSGSTRPSLDAITEPAAISEDSIEQSIALSGISSQLVGNPQTRITATSSDTTLIPHPNVDHDGMSANATLRYTPVANANGSAVVSVVVVNSGPDGDLNTAFDNGTTTRTFTVQVSSVNDAPSFSIIGNQVVDENSGSQSVTNFATSFLPGGGSDESEQSLAGYLTTVVTGSSLFAAQPSVSATGTLSYTVANGESGTAEIRVRAQDDGGTAGGGVDLSEPRSFNIVVNSVSNPVLTISGGQTLDLASASAAQLTGVETIDLRGGNDDDNVLLLDAPRVASAFSNGTLLVLANSGDQVVFDANWDFDAANLVDGVLQRRFINGAATVNVVGPDDFTNPFLRYDVNGSGSASSLDALVIINELSQGIFSESPLGTFLPFTQSTLDRFNFYDVSLDGRITPLDALQVINELARQSSGAGESEQGLSAIAQRANQDSVTREDELLAVTEFSSSEMVSDVPVIAKPELPVSIRQQSESAASELEPRSEGDIDQEAVDAVLTLLDAQ